MPITYVLYIEFADDPPRVAVFDTFDAAKASLDYFEVSLFDLQNNEMNLGLFRARIFECRGANWGTEIDIEEKRRRMRHDIAAAIKKSSE